MFNLWFCHLNKILVSVAKFIPKSCVRGCGMDEVHLSTVEYHKFNSALLQGPGLKLLNLIVWKMKLSHFIWPCMNNWPRTDSAKCVVGLESRQHRYMCSSYLIILRVISKTLNDVSVMWVQIWIILVKVVSLTTCSISWKFNNTGPVRDAVFLTGLSAPYREGFIVL